MKMSWKWNYEWAIAFYCENWIFIFNYFPRKSIGSWHVVSLINFLFFCFSTYQWVHLIFKCSLCFWRHKNFLSNNSALAITHVVIVLKYAVINVKMCLHAMMNSWLELRNSLKSYVERRFPQKPPVDAFHKSLPCRSRIFCQSTQQRITWRKGSENVREFRERWKKLLRWLSVISS